MRAPAIRRRGSLRRTLELKTPPSGQQGTAGSSTVARAQSATMVGSCCEGPRKREPGSKVSWPHHAWARIQCMQCGVFTKGGCRLVEDPRHV